MPPGFFASVLLSHCDFLSADCCPAMVSLHTTTTAPNLSLFPVYIYTYINGHVCWNSKRWLPFIVCRTKENKLPFSVFRFQITNGNLPLPFSVCSKQTYRIKTRNVWYQWQIFHCWWPPTVCWEDMANGFDMGGGTLPSDLSIVLISFSDLLIFVW
jgi:hypothetical protein